MRTITRHIAVFMIGLALAAATAFLTPVTVDSRDIFFAFLVLFVLYLGIATFLATLKRKRIGS